MSDVHLNLTAEEAESLYSLLKEELPDIRYEVARTDNVDLKHWLAERRARLEHICQYLRPEVRGAGKTAEARGDSGM